MSHLTKSPAASTIADRTAQATWQGPLPTGHGSIRSGSGALDDLEVTWVARTAQPGGRTSPEELCAAAHSTCFSMTLALKLGEHGASAQSIEVAATVTLADVGGVPTITSSALQVTAAVAGLDQPAFDAIVAQASELCPVSRLFAHAEITIAAHLNEA